MPLRRRSRSSTGSSKPRPAGKDTASHSKTLESGPSRAELFELYKIALEEYRFQVTLNWNRTQYYLVLNVGILGVATGILQLGQRNVAFLAAGLYFAGLVCCLLSLSACHVQHGYYRRARDHKADIESLLHLADLRLQTTPGMGSTIRRLGKVKTFNNSVLSIIAALDTAGTALGILRIL